MSISIAVVLCDSEEDLAPASQNISVASAEILRSAQDDNELRGMG